MYRATTPTHTFDLGTDTEALSKIVISYQQNGEIVLEKTKPDVVCNGNIVTVKLTQEETKGFDASIPLVAQVRFKTADGTVLASSKITLSVHDVLNDEVL